MGVSFDSRKAGFAGTKEILNEMLKKPKDNVYFESDNRFSIVSENIKR